jgi:uncharacterized protein
LWAGIGLFGAVISIALAGAAMTYLNGETPAREVRQAFPLVTRPFWCTTICWLLFLTLYLSPQFHSELFDIRFIWKKISYVLNYAHFFIFCLTS